MTTVGSGYEVTWSLPSQVVRPPDRYDPVNRSFGESAHSMAPFVHFKGPEGFPVHPEPLLDLIDWMFQRHPLPRSPCAQAKGRYPLPS
jgi:hypothetical protein